MLNPPMKTLIEKTGNRYLLVNLAAKRARDIAIEAEMQGEIIDEKPVAIALEEIADGTIEVIHDLKGLHD
ncbi:MAG: DNA-directed RNA polymerase subunit omega [Clostridia bacterium]